MNEKKLTITLLAITFANNRIIDNMLHDVYVCNDIKHILENANKKN